MKRLVYLVGVPGAGKSTVVRKAMEHLPMMPESRPKPFQHLYWPKQDASYLGRSNGDFPGTDTLSMSVQPKVLEWLREGAPSLVFGEGDRLANLKFLEGAQHRGYQVELCYLDTPASLAIARRRERGSNQGQAWLKGRESKVRRLVDSWELEHKVYRFDGRCEAKHNGQLLFSWLMTDPAS